MILLFNLDSSITIYLLSDSENIESSDPAKNSKGIGRSTYVNTARENNKGMLLSPKSHQ